MQRKEILKKLTSDVSIFSISQLLLLPGLKTTYAERTGVLIMNVNLRYDSIQSILKSFDYTYKGPISGTGNYHEFLSNTKMVDKAFFDTYNRACTLPDVISGSLRFYSKVELDTD